MTFHADSNIPCDEHNQRFEALQRFFAVDTAVSVVALTTALRLVQVFVQVGRAAVSVAVAGFVAYLPCGFGWILKVVFLPR